MKKRILSGSLLVLFVLTVALVSFPAGIQDDPRGGLALYEPSPAYPYGRPNPAAPPELRQFDFMVGEFDCKEATRNADGSWNEFWAIWNARYFLNGFGIQDVCWILEPALFHL